MAQKPDGKAAKTERVTFTRPAAERIAKVVRQVEAGDRKGAALSFGARVPAAATKLRLGTFTGAWATATYKVVTLSGSTNTAQVLNACNDVFVSTCERTVVFSQVAGTQIALEVQFHPTCTTCHQGFAGISLSAIPHHNAGQIQMLGHDESNCLRWYSVTTCT